MRGYITYMINTKQLVGLNHLPCDNVSIHDVFLGPISRACELVCSHPICAGNNLCYVCAALYSACIMYVLLFIG